MGASKALAERIVEARAGVLAHPLRGRALRQRARQLRLGAADLPAPDRRGRAGHGDAPGDDPLLHDHPRGRAAGDRGRRHRRRAATSSCSTWASRCGSWTSPAARSSCRARTSRSRSSASAPARSSTRSSSTWTRRSARPATARSCAPPGRPLDPAVLREGSTSSTRRVAAGRPEPVADALWSTLRGARIAAPDGETSTASPDRHPSPGESMTVIDRTQTDLPPGTTAVASWGLLSRVRAPVPRARRRVPLRGPPRGRGLPRLLVRDRGAPLHDALTRPRPGLGGAQGPPQPGSVKGSFSWRAASTSTAKMTVAPPRRGKGSPVYLRAIRSARTRAASPSMRSTTRPRRSASR